MSCPGCAGHTALTAGVPLTSLGYGVNELHCSTAAKQLVQGHTTRTRQENSRTCTAMHPRYPVAEESRRCVDMICDSPPWGHLMENINTKTPTPGASCSEPLGWSLPVFAEELPRWVACS